MIEERIRRFQDLSNNRYYKHFNIVLEELLWGRRHALATAIFYL